jgi:hypothetical protein
LGNGDMLFLWPGTSTLLRGQGTYLSDDEINRVVDFVGTTEPQFAKELVALKPKSTDDGKGGVNLKNRDDLYESAVDVVIREGRGSVSLLQRALGIGYGRAARLIDYMAEDGIVGEYNGSQARDILITLEQWAEMQGEKPEAEETPPPKPKKNRILPVRNEEMDDDEEDDDDDSDDDLEDDDPDDDDSPFDDDPDDVVDEDVDDEDEGPPIRGPHRAPLSNPRKTTSATLMVEPADDDSAEDEAPEDEAADECDEDSGALAGRRFASETEDGAARGDADEEPATGEGDERYTHINPALLARLRAKRLRDQRQRLRRSA